ncbi:hypothetical protein HC928_09405, partial [bacterium]|nr:hypothetical protein [bacterium]
MSFTLFGRTSFYRIKRGEKTVKSQEIDNELAARLLLAFDIKESWTCHQSYKLFDELHTTIFNRPQVNADRIVAVSDVFGVVVDRLQRVNNRLLATYTLTKFFLLYLIREAIEGDDLGKQFIQNPSTLLRANNGR